MIGRGTCYHHGGKTPVGSASPHYRHGRYSSVLPTRLVEKYQEARDDGELLALRDEAALISARLMDVLARVDTGESARLWNDLQTVSKELQAAKRSRDTVALLAAVDDAIDLIERGHADYAAWDDVRGLVRDRQRLVESERKRLVDMQQMVTATEVMTLAAALSELVREHVPNEEARRQIGAGLMRLLGNRGAGRQ